VYSINTFDQSERLAQYADEIGSETKFAPPFKLLHVDTTVFIAPCLPDGAIERGFGEKPFSSVDGIPSIDEFALTLIELQRERKLALFPGMPAAHYVGGFAEVTTLTKDRVESRVIHRWDEDQIGELITPEPIDWSKWRAELQAPLAPPPGLSRLKAEMWAKKQRKGTLREAA
jgi:hypothetical protein